MTSSLTSTNNRPEEARPRVPHTVHLREFVLPDGRKLQADRRSVAFIVEGKPEEFGGKIVTIIAWKTMAKAVPVVAAYSDLRAWWRDDKEGRT